MRNIKHLKKWIPEIYLLVSAIYYWVMTGALFNIIAILLLLVLTVLIVLKNKMLGIIISTLFLVLNLYMVLALISELKEYDTFNNDAQLMLLFGSTYLGLNIFISIIMLVKWIREIPPTTRTSNASTS